MIEKIYTYALIPFFLLIVSCSVPEDQNKIAKLEEQVDSLVSENDLLQKQINDLTTENFELGENLKKYEDEQAKIKQAEQERLKKLKNASQGLVYGSKIQVKDVKTGFDPYHNDKGLFLPSVSLMFENISPGNIDDYVKVRAVFIDNSNGEQLSEDFEYLCTSSRPFSASAKKQITLQSSVGWYGLQDQDIKVKISIEDDPFKTYEIENIEYRGRI